MTGSSMREVLVLQHVACEGPGAIGAALQRCGLRLRIVHAYVGEPVPPALAAESALVRVRDFITFCSSRSTPEANTLASRASA